jgi:RHS repeat-associated protein
LAADYDEVMSGPTLYMQQRYYEPLAGRFLSVDPVVTDRNTGRSFNRYRYAANNPYRYVDPDGRDPSVKDQEKKPVESALQTITITGVRGATSGPGISLVTKLGVYGAAGGLTVSGVQSVSKKIPGSNIMAGTYGPWMANQGSNGEEQSDVKPDREQRPNDVPTGTKPVDQDRRLDRQKIHDIKDQLGAGPKDWVGIDPSGNIWTSEGGKGANQGPYSDYINSGKGR